MWVKIGQWVRLKEMRKDCKLSKYAHYTKQFPKVDMSVKWHRSRLLTLEPCVREFGVKADDQLLKAV